MNKFATLFGVTQVLDDRRFIINKIECKYSFFFPLRVPNLRILHVTFLLRDRHVRNSILFLSLRDLQNSKRALSIEYLEARRDYRICVASNYIRDIYTYDPDTRIIIFHLQSATSEFSFLKLTSLHTGLHNILFSFFFFFLLLRIVIFAFVFHLHPHPFAFRPIIARYESRSDRESFQRKEMRVCIESSNGDERD